MYEKSVHVRRTHISQVKHKVKVKNGMVSGADNV